MATQKQQQVWTLLLRLEIETLDVGTSNSKFLDFKHKHVNLPLRLNLDHLKVQESSNSRTYTFKLGSFTSLEFDGIIVRKKNLCCWKMELWSSNQTCVLGFNHAVRDLSWSSWKFQESSRVHWGLKFHDWKFEFLGKIYICGLGNLSVHLVFVALVFWESNNKHDVWSSRQTRVVAVWSLSGESEVLGEVWTCVFGSRVGRSFDQTQV